MISRTTIQDFEQFVVAILIVGGGGYALAFATGVDPAVKVLIGGLIGSVVTYFFGHQVATHAAVETVNTLNGLARSAATGIAQPGGVPGSVGTPEPRA